MTITKQDRARFRNWNKARLMGFTLTRDGLTNGETDILNQILILKRQLLDKWDENSTSLGMKIRPRKELRYD